jgi:outer membrane protein TolC
MMRAALGIFVAASAAVVSPLVGQGPVRLSFAEAVRRAAGEAPAVALATLRTDEATARVRQARAALLPSLGAAGVWVNRDFNSRSLGINFPGIPVLVPSFNNYDARLTATQTLFDWSSAARVRAASARADGSRADASVTVEGAAQTAALAYLRATRAQALVAARQADSSIAAELVGLAQAQRAAGVSPSIDVTRARTQLVSAEGLLIVARNQRDRARIDVARALGLDPGTPPELTDTLAGTLGAADLGAEAGPVVAAALANRPDLKAELARGAAARRTSSAIRAERLPQLDLEADYGANGITVPSAIATRQVALKVTVPIFDGLRREARLAEQDAVAQESQVRERDLRHQITADVDTAFLNLGSAEAQQAIAAEQFRLALDELSQARERFRAGVAGNIDVINAQSNLIRARDTDIDARFAAASSRVALARAAGVAHTLH